MTRLLRDGRFYKQWFVSIIIYYTSDIINYDDWQKFEVARGLKDNHILFIMNIKKIIKSVSYSFIF